MGLILTIIGVILFFQELNILGLIISLIALVTGEILRKNNNSKTYSIASVLNGIYVARYILVLIINLIERI